jgi:glyoxylase-like metal-dependent hydrolase (beta-lactamase superfamily II)
VYISKLYRHAKIKVVGSSGSAERVEKKLVGKTPQVTEVIPDEGWSLALRGDVQIQLSLVEGHSAGDVLLYVPPTSKHVGFVHLVDFIFPGWVPFRDFALAKDFEKYTAVHDAALKFNFDVLSGGHLTRLGSRKDVEDNLEYTKDVIAAATNAVKTQTNFTDIFSVVNDPAAVEAGNIWYSFSQIRSRQSNTCYRDLVAKWACRLGGLNEYGRSHCNTAVQYVILDT